MKIRVNCIVGGFINTIKSQALVDTGAEVSLIPRNIAMQIGAEETDQYKNIVGIHKEIRILPVVAACLSFPSLTKEIHKFPFVMSDEQTEIIVGMDILKPTGINIDTKTSKLTVKNEIWEAFKSIAGDSVLRVVEILISS